MSRKAYFDNNSIIIFICWLVLLNRGNANATLTVTEVKQASEGIYSCNASSSAGWNISSTFLDIKGLFSEIL